METHLMESNLLLQPAPPEKKAKKKSMKQIFVMKDAKKKR